MAVLNVNGKALNHNADPRTPLLWVLREQLGLTGTKYGCGIAQCGACTVHIDGVATRSCQVPVNSVGAKKIATIEGLADERQAEQDPGGLGGARRAPVRLLPERHDHGGDRAARGQAQSDRRRHRRGHDQHLSLRHLPQVREAIHAAAKA